jgi:hypothetical protein
LFQNLKRQGWGPWAQPMPQWTQHLCRLILKLDHIPRYGRLYPAFGPGSVFERLDAEDKGLPVPPRKVEWRYMRYGRWGLDLLDKVDLLWPYIDTPNPFDEEDDPDVPVR